MDNSELLQQLVTEQQRTNRLLAMQELRARQTEDEAERVKIAKLEGVDPSQILLNGPTYIVMRRNQDNQ